MNIAEITAAHRAAKLKAQAEAPRAMLHTLIDPEPCCKRAWAKDAKRVAITEATAEWACAECGQVYKPETVGNIRKWAAHIFFEVMR